MNQTHPDWDGIAAEAADMAVDLLGGGPRDGSCLSEAQKVAVGNIFAGPNGSTMPVGLPFEVVEVEVPTDAYASCHQKRQVTLACPTSGQL